MGDEEVQDTKERMGSLRSWPRRKKLCEEDVQKRWMKSEKKTGEKYVACPPYLYC
jgi:hypothetical protein